MKSWAPFKNGIVTFAAPSLRIRPISSSRVVAVAAGSLCIAAFFSSALAEPDSPSPETPFLLVKDGKALAPLVLAANATPRNREAAEELATAIQKISGAEMEIIEAAPANAPERGVWIGMQPGIEALFPGVDLTLAHPEEIRIVTEKNHLLIAGRDVFDPKMLTKEALTENNPDDQWEYGTANAVYTFLQESLGVRWLYPGPAGTDYPESASITIPPTNLRYHPQFLQREGVFALSKTGRSGKETSDWMRRQRLLLDSLDAHAGHAFEDWWEKYGQSHPEFFALQPDGTRGTYPPNPKYQKLCQAEPAVWEMWLREAGESLKENPMQTCFNVSENDGWGAGNCVDPLCQAWDPPIKDGIQLVTHNYANGVRFERPPLSDRNVTFANKLSEMLKTRYPDKSLFVTVHAYGETGRPAPVSAKPNENVIIQSVNNFLFRGKSEREEQMANFDAWSKVSPKIVWRPNMSGSSGWSWGTPDVGFTRAAHDIKWVAERGAIGLFIDAVWNHWATQGPLYYLLAQLAWNPDADPDAIVKDFCERSYGPAGNTMLSYWRLMEKMRDRIEDESPSRWRMVESPRFYTAEFFKEAQGLLDQAVKETADGPETYRQRVEMARAGLHYTELVIDTRMAMQRWEDSKQTDEKAKSHVLANWARTDEMRKTFPEYAVNWPWVFRNDKIDPRMRRRMYGLHPEYVLPERFQKEFLAGQSAAQDQLE